jgi:IS605 OrfB family transposase
LIKDNKKNIEPFWNNKSKKNSKHLWIPTKTNTIKSDSKMFPENKMLNSWFNVKIKKSTDENKFKINKALKHKEVRTKNLIRTIKTRIFPTEQQLDILKEWEGSARWFWNRCLWILKFMEESPIVYKEEDKKPQFSKFKVQNTTIREFIRRVEMKADYSYDENYIYEFIESCIYSKDNKAKFPDIPDSKYLFPAKAYRGTIKELTQSINPLITKRKNGEKVSIKNLGFRRKKDHIGTVQFEGWINNDNPFTKTDFGECKGYYAVGRKRIPLNELYELIKRGSFNVQRNYNKYFINFSVPIEEFQNVKNYTKRNNSMNRNNESQIVFRHPVISLDPGIRTFQTGYCLDHTVQLGKNDLIRIKDLLLKRDEMISQDRTKKARRIYRRILGLVNELHWKIIGFLTKNYDVIILPEFETSKMLKGKKISKMTKRLMQAFSFYKFKERLKMKCEERNCVLHIVDESYTSKTCESVAVSMIILAEIKFLNV